MVLGHQPTASSATDLLLGEVNAVQLRLRCEAVVMEVSDDATVALGDEEVGVGRGCTASDALGNGVPTVWSMTARVAATPRRCS
jgi:hypothetical protein